MKSAPFSLFPSTAFATSRPVESYGNSPHLVRRPDPKQRQPRGEYGDYALHQDETSQGHLWIILDNEA